MAGRVKQKVVLPAINSSAGIKAGYAQFSYGANDSTQQGALVRCLEQQHATRGQVLMTGVQQRLRIADMFD